MTFKICALVLLALPCAACLSGEPPASDGTFWSFAPPSATPLPAVQNRAWIRSPIDRFVLAKLEQAGFEPAKHADKRTLLRRVTFDLTGLPPTMSEIEDFLADTASGAWERVVERLLASPRYGERWGRHWLDLARYADSNGQDENKSMSHAFHYRDYVIAAFNRDKPFDRFIREQLAGDLLPANSEAEQFENWTATGLLVLGPKMLAEQDKPKLVMDVVDEQIDVVSRVFLGLTVSCARCHDHKFDPVTARDYYALAGIFKSTKSMANLDFVSQWNERPLANADELARWKEHPRRVEEIRGKIERIVRSANEQLVAEWRKDFDVLSPEQSGAAGQAEGLREALDGGGGNVVLPTKPREYYPKAVEDELARLEREGEELKRTAPAEPVMVLAVEEGSVADLPVHLRGSHLTLANDPVPRGFIEAVNKAPGVPSPRDQSGRRELAEWLVHPRHPLTARVAVNRIWQWHFGNGLVRTPDNFGLRGEKPSHPELLDWLALEFIRQGWSFKNMHRLILLSNTYWMSSTHDAAAAAVDPENRLLWRMNRRRLDAEEVRDSLLFVAGDLDLKTGGTLVTTKNNEYIRFKDYESKLRSVYLPVVRDRVYDVLTILDFANPSVTTSQRVPTVVSHQALFFMNSPLVRTQAKRLAAELLSFEDLSEAGRVEKAYQRVLARPGSAAEIERARRFIEMVPGLDSGVASSRERVAGWEYFCQALLASNEFLYLD